MSREDCYPMRRSKRALNFLEADQTQPVIEILQWHPVKNRNLVVAFKILNTVHRDKEH